MARIADFALDFIREPLRQPFGFKGGSLSELWQVVCRVELDDGRCGYGVGVQSVLWSDGCVLCAYADGWKRIDAERYRACAAIAERRAVHLAANASKEDF